MNTSIKLIGEVQWGILDFWRLLVPSYHPSGLLDKMGTAFDKDLFLSFHLYPEEWDWETTVVFILSFLVLFNITGNC